MTDARTPLPFEYRTVSRWTDKYGRPRREPIIYRFATEAQRDAFINGRWP